MPLSYPYKRTCRQFVDGTYENNGRWQYILDKNYADSPEHYVRAYEIIQKDLLHLFTYVEPSDVNLCAYSFRICELLIRTCIEIEANFKAILRENGYNKSEDKYNMSDYRKINKTHRLSSYQIFVPYWKGEHSYIKPFEKFSLILDDKQTMASTPQWYNAYTSVKHNRLLNFQKANLENLIDAVSALVVVLSSQFCREDFSPGETLLSMGGPQDKMESAIGTFFRVKFPDDWPEEERYDFEPSNIDTKDWKILKYYEE